MDHNGDNDNEDFDFGIHLDDLIESEESPETGSTLETDNSPETDDPDEAPDSEGGAPEAYAEQDPEASGEPSEEGAPGGPEADIAAIKESINILSEHFESKLKYDAHKNKVIDELHRSLQDYRDGILKKYLQRIFTDVIKIIDDVRKLTGYYRDQPLTQENTAKLIQYLEDVAHDLEDIFAWEGVVSFSSDSDMLDATRQRVVSKIETEDPAKDKMVAERLRPGYEWDGKVIRPEIVSIYVCNHDSAPDNKEI
ncbi:MAG: nucleotide exchange factor GrpE [Desulfosalsimonas sp.]